MNLKQWLARTAAVAMLGLAGAASAAVPTSTMVEGFLTSVGGGPVVDGYYDIAFALYKEEFGGNPLFTEGPVPVTVKNGMWSWQLGSKTPLQPSALANVPALWIAVKVGNEAELPRRPVTSVAFAMRTAVAEGLDCSGCVGAGQLDPKALEGYAKTSALAKVATSGKFEDLTGGPDLTGYAKTVDLGAYAKSSDLGLYAKSAGLAKVATSGAYADLTGTPDLTGYAKAASLAKVAGSGAYADLAGAPDLNVFAKLAALAKVATSGSYKDLADLPALATVASSGDYADLKGAPVVPVVGKTCGTGLVLRGFKADGAYDCVAGGGKPLPADLPPDGIDEISNGLIHNQFVDATAGTPKVAIKDNNPVGIADTLAFPDIGVAQGLTVSVQIANSDLSTVRVSVFDPNSVEYVLCGGVDGLGKPYPACGKTGDALKTSFPAPTATASGDLTSWIGKNPKGNWILKVVDLGFLNNGTDGEVTAWSVGIQTLSNKKIQVKGNGIFDGSVRVGNDSADCTPATAGTIRWTGKLFQGCTGNGWTSFSGPDGSSQSNASTTCATLHADFPNLADGLYWIDPNGGSTVDAFQAPCNMTRQGGGWTMGVKTWYQSGVAGNAGAIGNIGDALALRGNGWKLSDAQIRDVIGSDKNFDVMIDQAGYNSGYSNGNYEYVVIKNYTADWTFAGKVAGSSTTTSMFSYRASDNAQAWTGNFQCGDVGGWGINCYNILSGSNPAGGANCNPNMGASTSSGWHHIYMADTNSDTYLYVCNGAQHSSGYNMNHRVWFR
jgi:subtilisin-like proprotein convertase family protein